MHIIFRYKMGPASRIKVSDSNMHLKWLIVWIINYCHTWKFCFTYMSKNNYVIAEKFMEPSDKVCQIKKKYAPLSVSCIGSPVASVSSRAVNASEAITVKIFVIFGSGAAIKPIKMTQCASAINALLLYISAVSARRARKRRFIPRVAYIADR